MDKIKGDGKELSMIGANIEVNLLNLIDVLVTCNDDEVRKDRIIGQRELHLLFS